MTFKQNNGIDFVSMKAFQAVGLKWQGTFAEASAGAIRVIQSELQNRLQEIRYIKDEEILYGLSYHAMPGGNEFTHYSVVEVEKVERLPVNMVRISVPSLTYAKYEHRKGESIVHSYENVYTLIEDHGYKENHINQLTHVEKYPISQDPYDEDPEFLIMIPVVKK